MAKKRVLGVVGMGHVGAHVAYALAIQGIADELVLVDQNEQKLASEVQDLRDAVAYMPHRVTVRGGDFSDLGVCDVIVNSVGKIDLLRGTHDRVTEKDFTIPAVRGYAEKIKASGFDGVLINITNPCDIVTRELALHLGLPRGRVFGTGTGLGSNIMFAQMHIDAAASLGMNPITVFAGQNAGASLGNLICPNNTVAACATVDQVGNESDVMKKTFKAFAIILVLYMVLAMLYTCVLFPNFGM